MEMSLRERGNSTLASKPIVGEFNTLLSHVSDSFALAPPSLSSLAPAWWLGFRRVPPLFPDSGGLRRGRLWGKAGWPDIGDRDEVVVGAGGSNGGSPRLRRPWLHVGGPERGVEGGH